jgi:hypothetical protein
MWNNMLNQICYLIEVQQKNPKPFNHTQNMKKIQNWKILKNVGNLKIPPL